MYEEPFEVMALDSNFEIVSLISYANLQWSRKFHEVGSFSILLQGRQYSTTWKYIYSKSRKELGIISQVNWGKKNYIESVTISGYFVESELNKMICYALPSHFYDESGDFVGTSLLKNEGLPTWVSWQGTADQVAKKFFESFKKIAFTNYEIGDDDGDTLTTSEYELDIDFGTIDSSHGSYHRADHNRNNERLGDKLYKILKFSGASFEVIWDFSTHEKTLNIIHGKDLTQDNTDGNNPVIFSSANGNIISASLVISNADTKDAVIQTAENQETTYVLVNQKSDSIGRFTHQGMKTSINDYIKSDTPSADIPAQNKAFKLAAMEDATTILDNYTDKQNIEFQIYRGSYEYMKDYDLGDLISIQINEIGLSLDARIIACYEVVKRGAWELTLEIGTPLIKSFSTE